MLVEIMCEEFKDHGTSRGRIQLHSGLNTVMGSSSGSNSIGKSTFLMIIDFVFGGDDYVEKLTDVQTEVGEHRICFETLDRRIMNLSPAVKREYKKLYIAYKLDTNFVDIVVQKQRLRISVNMKFSEVYDPNGICRDVTGLGRWGNGDVELFMEHTSDIDRVIEIIEQSYKLQAD